MLLSILTESLFEEVDIALENSFCCMDDEQGNSDVVKKRTGGCQKADGKPYSSLFTLKHLVDMGSQASLMTHQELDLVILGSLMTTPHDHETLLLMVDINLQRDQK